MSSLSTARFEQFILDRGLATEEELKAARGALLKAQAAGQRATLPEALVKSGALTRSQVLRVLSVLKEETVSPTIQVPGVQLLERLGRGSQAVVYKGRQLSVDRIVAVKILSSKVAQDPENRRRFIQEAKSAARLSHNNIVQAIDAGEAEGHCFFLQEYVDGPSVADILVERGSPVEETEALRIVIQIAEALAHAHSRGFIHRDVKPKNILLTQEGVAKLADMGLARQAADVDAALEEAGKAYGTPYYISPEQVRGDPRIDFRADIYSLGATFYEMLAGRPPYLGPTPQDVMRKHVTGTLVPPDHINPVLSAGVSEVVEVMMSKRPEDRYRSTEDLLVDLRSVAAGDPPRIAREKVGMQAAIMEGLASGQEVEVACGDPGAPRRPPALQYVTIALAILLGVSVLLNILLAIL
jgi:serine/threonine-protein kinase